MSNRKYVNAVYSALVNRVPGIRERYKKTRYQGRKGVRCLAWAYLVYLNIAYHIFRRRRIGALEKYPFYESKILYTKGSESSLSVKKTPQETARELADHDVISFDVFDTLVLRPFSSPTDLFFLLGEELEYMDFKRIRMEMEWKAREQKYKKEKTYEITLDEIYTLLERETGIGKEKAMQRETELEQEYCFANPYMMQVVKELKRMGKRLIVTSDMYLSRTQIEKILQKCGYDAFDQYYVSCESGNSKSRGSLYDEVRKRESCHLKREELTFVHIGDNEISDIQNARKHGFDAKHYVNVNTAGEQYRPADMSAIAGSVYRGIVNAHIHNGLKLFPREYEYGFIYGGLFVTGYCQFIHRYAEREKPDRLLFLARDGDVLLKAYKLLYPGGSETCRYAYWSRLAALKMAAGYFKYDYFRRFLYHKADQGYSLKQIFHSMELDDMLPELPEDMQDGRLTGKNVDALKTFLLERWDEVLTHYGEQLEAGKQYYKELLTGCKKAAAVDIGWAGSGAVALDHIVNDVWQMDCQITGIIAGTNTCHNAEPDASETFLQSGKLVSYLYSQHKNRDLWKLHDPGKGHNLYWEMLLDAPHGSLKGFYLDASGRWECQFKEPSADKKKVEEIQKGILDFVGQYKKLMERSELFGRISGRDAYAPMVLAESKANEGFMKKNSGMLDEMDVG